MGLASLDERDLDFVREVYPSLDGDLRAALRFANERHVAELLGESYLSLVNAGSRTSWTAGPRGTDQRNLGKHELASDTTAAISASS